jgi:hypothetical protein
MVWVLPQRDDVYLLYRCFPANTMLGLIDQGSELSRVIISPREVWFFATYGYGVCHPSTVHFHYYYALSG